MWRGKFLNETISIEIKPLNSRCIVKFPIWEFYLDKLKAVLDITSMRVISRRTLMEFYNVYDDAKAPLETWFHEVKKATWNDWTDVKAHYKSASILKNNRVVFNIGGNKYRLIVKINYPAQIVYIRFVGDHKAYDKVNAEEI